jgi:hypothetical protein
MIGIPKYNHEACTAYVIDKLRDNGFVVKYTHPNLLFISWQHWIPSYVRTEIKKKTGVVIDGYGNKVIKKDTDTELSAVNILNPASNKAKDQDRFKNIETYKPGGKLIYNDDLIKKINSKLS